MRLHNFFNTVLSTLSIILLFAPLATQAVLVSSAGSFNSNLIQGESIRPELTNDKATVRTEVPLLSFLPFQSGNPRTIQTSSSQNIAFQIYFNNGGDSAILNPNASVEVVKETENRYRIKGTLNGSSGNVAAFANNVGISANSALKGGDLIFSVPNDSDVSIVGNSTRIYKNVLTSFPDYPNGISGTETSTIIADNTQNGVPSNPLYTSVVGKQIPQSSGYKIDDRLDTGATNYGYITSKISITTKSTSQNKAPILADQQLTINRGTSNSFAPYACSDQDNNLPCTYQLNNLPSFCTNNDTTRIINCTTNSQTPALSTFTISPKDSTGLTGGIANFIVNVTDSNTPNLSVEKSCVKKDTTNQCNTINLTKGDTVSYTITLKAQGIGPVKNIKVVDTYDKEKITSLSETKPQGDNDVNAGNLTVPIGDLSPNDTKNITYFAKITENVANGDTVNNKVKVTADNAPTIQTQNTFTINLPGQPNLSTSYKTCFKKGTDLKCDESELNPGDTITYKVIIKNSGSGIAYNVNTIDTYTKDNYSEITNASAPGTIDNATGVVNWLVGTINGGETKELTFDAKINKDLAPGAEIVNKAVIKADSYPEQKLTYSFVLFSSTGSVESPRTGGYIFWTLVLAAVVGGSGYYYYKKNNKISKAFVPHRSKEG